MKILSFLKPAFLAMSIITTSAAMAQTAHAAPTTNAVAPSGAPYSLLSRDNTVLLLVDQDGVACHTGRRNCFFRAWRDGGWVEIAQPLVSPEELYGDQQSQ